jgi:hypothetical protein
MVNSMTDTEKADHAEQIAAGNFGRVAERSSDAITIELPADIAPGISWGELRPIWIGSRQTYAPQRVPTMGGAFVTTAGEQLVTMYKYKITL